MSAIPESVGEKVHNFLRYGIGYIARWIFIGISFIYLISLVIALHEAINFQRSVEGMFTERSLARRVLAELYNHINSKDPPLEQAYPVPVGAMAIRLDALKNAFQELGNYRLKDGQPAPPDLNQTATADTEKEFRGKLRDLQHKLDHLQNLLYENSPHIKIVGTFMEIEDISGQLEQFTIPVAASDESTARNTIAVHQTAKADPQLRLEQAHSQQTIPKSLTPEANLVPAQAPHLPADIPNTAKTAFNFQAAAEFRYLIDNLKINIEKLAVKRKTDPNDSAETALPSHSENIEAIANEIEVLEEKRRAANGFGISLARLRNLVHALNENMLNDKQKFNQALFNSIQSNLYQLTTFQGAQRLQMIKSVPATVSYEDYPNVVNTLNDSLKTLEQNISLTEEFKAIAKIKEMAIAINAMKASVESIRGLSDIEVIPLASKTDPNAHFEENENTAQLKFESHLGGLSQAIVKLENEFSTRKPEAMLAKIIDPDPQAQTKAKTILTDYRSLSEFDAVLLPFKKSTTNQNSYRHSFGINTRYIATLSYESLTLMFVFVIGAIGSLLYITKHFLHQAIQGHGWLDPPSRPLSWYLFRPIFGIVVALAVYLLVKAGQMAFGGSDSLGNLNLPIFSVVALFAGLLSWHALDAIESKGKKWFKTQSRHHLYATGLKHALAVEKKTISQCATQIGRREEQIKRWIDYKDRVTPEMQDRLITWLDRTVGELFRDEIPDNREGRPAPRAKMPKNDADDKMNA